MMNNIIFYKPGVQSQNAGDALINKQAIEIYSQYGDVYVVDEGLPEQYVREIVSGGGVRLSQFTSLDYRLYIVKRTLCALLSGSASQTYFVLPPGHVQRDGRKSVLVSLKVLMFSLVLRLLGGKVFRLGISLAGGSKLSGYAEAILSKTFCMYGVRDKKSFSYAEKYRFSKVVMVPDFAWGHTCYQRDDGSESDPQERKIFISFRSNAHGVKHDAGYLERHIEQLVGLVKAPEFSDCKLVVSYQVDFDRQAALQIYNHLQGVAQNVCLVDKSLAYSEAFEAYKEASFVISNRLHVLLLAGLASAVPVALVDVQDNQKIISLFDDLGMEEFVLNVDDSGGLGRLIEFSSDKGRMVSAKFEVLAHSERQKIENLLKEFFYAQ